MQKIINSKLIYSQIISGCDDPAVSTWLILMPFSLQKEKFQQPATYQNMQMKSGWGKKEIQRNGEKKNCKWRELVASFFCFFPSSWKSWIKIYFPALHKNPGVFVSILWHSLTLATWWSLMCVIHSHLVQSKTGFLKRFPSLMMLCRTGWSSSLNR